MSWERGMAEAALVSQSNRLLTVASYTWSPGTGGPIEGEIVEVGAGRPEDVSRAGARLKGRVGLATPSGLTLVEVIYNFYRAPGLAAELKEQAPSRSSSPRTSNTICCLSDCGRPDSIRKAPWRRRGPENGDGLKGRFAVASGRDLEVIGRKGRWEGRLSAN